MTDWTHDALQADLAAHLRGGSASICWENMQLGMSGSARPDVFRIDRSYVKPRPTAFECKVTRADFLRDVGAGKWNAYFDFADAVYFAVPAGLIKKAEVPQDAGLYARGPDGWRAVKAARPRRLDAIPQDVLLKLVIDGIDRQVSRRAFRGKDAAEYLNACAAAEAAEKRFGKDAGAALRDWASLRARLEGLRAEEASRLETRQRDEERHRERLREERARFMRDLEPLAAALGVAVDADAYELAAALRAARARLDASGVLQRCAHVLELAREDAERLTRRMSEELERLAPLPGARNGATPQAPERPA